MFGSSNPFGQSTSSPFASQPVFGQTNSTTFGAASSPAFGSSTPAFGSSWTPTFGSGGSSMFGQKPAFGAFSSTPTQSSPFGSTTQQSQSAFGTSVVGRTSPFGSTQPALSGTTAPFGSVTTSAFDTRSSPTFGSTSSFGFASTDAFGSSATTAFGAQSASPFRTQSVSSFAPSSTPSFSFVGAPSFGQTTSGFGRTQFGAQSSPFAAQSSASPFARPGVGQSPFRGQCGGSRVAPYTPTTDTDSCTTTQPPLKLESISAMPLFKDKSHEELRWEDYQLGDKGSTFVSPGVGQSPFEGQCGGSRVAPYTPTTDTDGTTTTQHPGKLESISAMSIFKDKSHEELRWEDYQLGDKASPFASHGVGQSPFGGQRVGSRVAPYTSTTDTDGSTTFFPQPPSKLELDSISAMPVYKDKSHEELRWEDYQLGDKGGPQAAARSCTGVTFKCCARSSLFAPSTPFSQTFPNPFSTTIPSNPFAPKTPSINNTGFATSTTPNPFAPAATSSPFASATTSNPFAPATTSNPFAPANSIPFGPILSAVTSLFNPTPSSLFSSSTSNSFSSASSSLFNPTPAPFTFSTGLNFSDQSSSPFNPTTPNAQPNQGLQQSSSSRSTLTLILHFSELMF